MPLKIKNKQVNAKNKILKEFLRYAIVILVAIISATLIRIFIFEPFIVYDHCMEPNLKVEDKVIINKLAYKFGAVKREDIVEELKRRIGC